jgi:hypothetical protein
VIDTLWAGHALGAARVQAQLQLPAPMIMMVSLTIVVCVSLTPRPQQQGQPIHLALIRGLAQQRRLASSSSSSSGSSAKVTVASRHIELECGSVWSTKAVRIQAWANVCLGR